MLISAFDDTLHLCLQDVSGLSSRGHDDAASAVIYNDKLHKYYSLKLKYIHKYFISTQQKYFISINQCFNKTYQYYISIID